MVRRPRPASSQTTADGLEATAGRLAEVETQYAKRIAQLRQIFAEEGASFSEAAANRFLASMACLGPREKGKISCSSNGDFEIHWESPDGDLMAIRFMESKKFRCVSIKGESGEEVTDEQMFSGEHEVKQFMQDQGFSYLFHTPA